MLLSLFLVGLVSSTGWHASVYRLSVDGCNEFKTRMQQHWFCGTNHFDCRRQRGSEVVGDSAEFQSQADVQPVVTAQGTWVNVANSLGFDLSEPLTAQCDVLRLAAVVGKPWNELFNGRSPSRTPIEHFELLVESPIHKMRVIQGESYNSIADINPEISQKTIRISGEINVELFILVEGTEVNFKITSLPDDLPMEPFFSPQKMGFLSSTFNSDGFTPKVKEVVHEPFFFAEDLREGFLQSPTARCINDANGVEVAVREMLYANEQGEFVASCSDGYRVPKFTMRKATSKRSAIGVCVADDNPAGDDTVETVSDALIDYSTARNMCAQKSKTIPTLTQVRNSDFCSRIYPFGHFFYIWVRNDVNENPLDVETVEGMIQHSNTDPETPDQDSLIVDIQPHTIRRIANGNDGIERLPGSESFPQLMQSNDRWGLVAEYTFPKNCEVLETTVSFNPVIGDPITSVSRWAVSRKNGVWTWATYVNNFGESDPQFDPSSIISSLRRTDEGGSPQHQKSLFIDYGEVNFMSGDTWIRPHGFPSALAIQGDSRTRRTSMHFRTFLAVDVPLQCSFGAVTSGSRSQFDIFGTAVPFSFEGGIRIGEWEQQISGVSTQQPLSLIPGRYYYIVGGYLEHQNPAGPDSLNFNGFSLMWDCGLGVEVIPRKYLFNVGHTRDDIVSNLVHMNVPEQSQFQVMVTSPPPAEGISVVCSGPSDLIITPNRFNFGESDWSDVKIANVYFSSTVSSRNGVVDPDVYIQCTSPGKSPLSISVSVQPTVPQHFLVSPSGHYANWFNEGNTWNVRDSSLAPAQESGCVYNLINYSDQFSFYIQTRHDSIGVSDINIGPVVGVAFAYGPYVYAAYSSVISERWNVYRLSSSTAGGPKISVESLTDPVNPGRVTVEFPCGSSCEIIPHGQHFMQLSCSISGSFTNTPWSEPVCVSPGQSFFHYPDGGTNNLIVQTSVPTWPTPSENNAVNFDSPVAPAILDGKSITFPVGEKITVNEVSEFTSWQDTLNNGGDLGWWSRIQSKCPLMSDKVVTALRPFSRSQTSQWVPELSSTQFIRSMLSRCHADNLMQKFLGCLGPYQFNEDDATQSLRSVIFDFITFARDVSNNFGMIGRSLTMLADNGVPGQLCSRLGHLVGSPPTCVCKANGGSAYPNCPDTIDCPPATEQQLSVMLSLANSVVGTEFCSAEKSIVIVRSLGVSVNCFRGFCYYWSNPRTRTGLKYEMCVTPYCVTGYVMSSVGSVIWYGLTECGETVISSNNGETWTVSPTSLPDDTVAEQLATPVGDQKVRVPLLPDGEYYEVDSSGIARAGISSGKMVTVTMKWWCECIDPDVWNVIV